MQKFTLLACVFYLFCCSCGHNAPAPDEKVISVNIPQFPSTLEIPINIAMSGLRQHIMSSITSPLIDKTQTISVPVINPVTEPVHTMVNVPFDYVCDHTETIKLGGWKCAACPVCCITTILVHQICHGHHLVDSIVNKDVFNRITQNVNLAEKVVLNDISFEGGGDTLMAHIKVGFLLKANIDATLIRNLTASCGSPEHMAEAEMILAAKVDITDSGTLNLSNKRWAMKWNVPCTLSAIDLPIEQLAQFPFIKQLLEKKIDDLVQNKLPTEISLKDKLTSLWPKIASPLKVSDLGYLNLNISQLNLNSLFASESNININVGAFCLPKFSLASNEPAQPLPTFPSFKKQPADSIFSINLLATSSLEKINEYAQKSLSNYQDKSGNNEIRFDGVKLYQSDSTVVIRVDLLKPFKGKIYLQGVPAFDLTTNTLFFKNLEYTAESRNIIVQFGDWLSHAPILEKILENKLRYSYEKNMNQAIKSFKDFTRDLGSGIILNAKLDTVSPVSIIVSDKNINLLVNIKGIAFVRVN